MLKKEMLVVSEEIISKLPDKAKLWFKEVSNAPSIRISSFIPALLGWVPGLKLEGGLVKVKRRDGKEVWGLIVWPKEDVAVTK